ncbi:MAG: HD domain-containing protein [Chloroflexi bacterium]|nr:HD domain-containing protein [Chloroflexota bacterium]
MAIPSRAESIDVLCAFQPPRWFLRHSIAVAEVAAFIADRLASQGVPVDRHLVEAAALLHDIDKLFDPDDPLRSLGHGDAGARWLDQHGYGELAGPVAAHPVSRLGDPERYRRWAAFSNRESRIVAYADKRAGQRVGSLTARLHEMERRHPEHLTSLRAALPRALRLEREVCAAAGIGPAEVRRSRWVAAAARERALRPPPSTPRR